jgi:methylthioribose-1-phosphate isomerase
VPVANPAFDVTPAALISGIISERGIAAAGALEQWTS